MKKTFVSLALALTLLACSATAAAPFSVRIKAEIPFDFMVRSKKLPKGDYVIETINDSGAMVIRREKGGKAVNFTVVKDKLIDKNKSKLVFRRYGDQYFLARIWDGSSDIVWKIEKSSAEKKVAKLFKDKSGKDEDEVPVTDKN